jgi:hypothetical protein
MRSEYVSQAREKVSQIERTYCTDWHIQLTHRVRHETREEEEEIEHHIAILTMQIVRLEGFEHECWSISWLVRDV